MALPLLAVSLTDSPALVAGVTVASRLPWLVFALVAGALVDRIDRRRAMVVVDLVRCALLVGLAALVLADAATIWMLYLVAFVLGMLETVFDTATQTIIPAIVERDRLSTANGRLFGVELLANQFVGPPVGGFLAALGIAAAFGVTAAGYLGAALLIASLSGVFRAERQGPPTSMRHEIWEGIRFLAGHPLLRTLALVVGGLNLAGGAAMAVLVLYAVEPGPMGLDAVGYGLLLTVIAAGTVLGTLGAGITERVLGKANLVTAVVIALAAQHLVMALTADPIPIAAVLAAGGIVLGAFNPVFVSFRQRLVPDRLLGRVVATFRVLGLGTLPLGAAIGGAIGEVLGLQAVFVFAALLTALLLPARLVLTEGAIAEAEAQAHALAAVGSEPPARRA